MIENIEPKDLGSARIHRVRISPKKLRPLASLLAKASKKNKNMGMRYDYANAFLSTQPTKSSRIFKSVLRNAFNSLQSKNRDVQEDQVYIWRSQVNGASSFSRLKPVARGRAHRIVKRRSHLTITVRSV